MEKLDLIHTHISGEILHCCDFSGWQYGNIHQNEKCISSTQELALGSYPKESISMQQVYIQCIYVQYTLNNLNIQQ